MDSRAKPEATGPIEFDLDAAAKAFEGIVGRILEQEAAIGADLQRVSRSSWVSVRTV